jgi:hypothetical protein
MEYVKDHAFVISDRARLSQLASLNPGSQFTFQDPEGRGSISMDGQGNLKISGAVYIAGPVSTGPGRTIDGIEESKSIRYVGTGTILAEGDVRIGTNLVTAGLRSFPQNIMGIMTPGSVTFERANVAAMGVFYGQESIVVTKQTSVAGSLVSNFVNMGSQVPSVYQVPAVMDNLPPYLIAAHLWGAKPMVWRVFREAPKPTIIAEPHIDTTVDKAPTADPQVMDTVQ